MPNTKLISAFVGGVQKSGTRSISNYLRRHPDIAVHKSKEGHFFDQDINFSNNHVKKDAIIKYHNQFELSDSTKLLCDITPDYIYRQPAIQRIYDYNSNSHWIILLRNPIERAYSAWNMEVNRKTETLSFEQALKSELAGNPNNRLHDRFQYIGRSRYYNQLKNLWNFFPKSQCHIFSAEEVWNNPQKILITILKLLNVQSSGMPNYEHIHKGQYKTSLSKEACDILEHELSFELKQLPKLLEWKKNPWT